MSDIAPSRRLTHQPDPALARLEQIFFPQGLTLEDRIRMGVRAAKLEMVPVEVEFLKRIPPEVKLASAFSLFEMAWDMLYLQGIRRGLTPEQASRSAAERMLKADAD